jgi:hypothetical protein
MWPLVIVEVEVTLQCREQFQTGGEIAGIDQLVLERAPQTFDKNIVQRTAAAIHADRDSALLERSQEIGRGELRALIGVPNFGLAKAEGGVERRQAEAGFHRVGKFPTEYEAAEPIHDGHQVEKAAMHRNVSNIGAPDVVGSFDGDAAQQVWVDLMTRRRAAQMRLGIVGFDAQYAHQALDAFAIHVQLDRHFAAAVERALHIELVELPEQTQVLCTLRLQLVVVGRARHSQQLALLLNAEARMGGIDPWALVVS